MPNSEIERIKMELWETFQDRVSRAPVTNDAKDELSTVFHLTVEHAMNRYPDYWKKGRLRVINATCEIAEWSLEASRYSTIRQDHVRWAACKVITKYHEICEQFIAKFAASLTAEEQLLLSAGCSKFMEEYDEHCKKLDGSQAKTSAAVVSSQARKAAGGGKKAASRSAASRKSGIHKKKKK